MDIRSHTFEEFVAMVEDFHGFAAPGVILGGFMVDLAYRHLPKEGFFDVLCETPKCLPDAAQLLTPCTTGNGWLTVINLGRYALTIFDKGTLEGVRVFVDAAKLEAWPEIRAWYLKLKPKKEQDYELLLREIRQAGPAVCGVQRVTVAGRFRPKEHRGGFAICPECKEAYPAVDGSLCRGCQDGTLYPSSIPL
jgi:formylmethanofuran dehydrogenase subunit E